MTDPPFTVFFRLIFVLYLIMRTYLGLTTCINSLIWSNSTFEVTLKLIAPIPGWIALSLEDESDLEKMEENILAASYVGCFTWPPKRYWAPKPPCIERNSSNQVLRANTGMFGRVTEDAPYTIQTSERTWLSLSCIFAELGLWSRQKFMHALSEAAKMPSITSHVEIKRGVNIANQLRHQSIDAVT